MSYTLKKLQPEDFQAFSNLVNLAVNFSAAVEGIAGETGLYDVIDIAQRQGDPEVLAMEAAFDELEADYADIEDSDTDGLTLEILGQKVTTTQALGELRITDLTLGVLFNKAASVYGAEAKLFAALPMGITSKANEALFEKYELKNLAAIARKAKTFEV